MVGLIGGIVVILVVVLVVIGSSGGGLTGGNTNNDTSRNDSPNPSVNTNRDPDPVSNDPLPPQPGNHEGNQGGQTDGNRVYEEWVERLDAAQAEYDTFMFTVYPDTEEERRERSDAALRHLAEIRQIVDDARDAEIRNRPIEEKLDDLQMMEEDYLREALRPFIEALEAEIEPLLGQLQFEEARGIVESVLNGERDAGIPPLLREEEISNNSLRRLLEDIDYAQEEFESHPSAYQAGLRDFRQLESDILQFQEDLSSPPEDIAPLQQFASRLDALSQQYNSELVDHEGNRREHELGALVQTITERLGLAFLDHFRWRFARIDDEDPDEVRAFINESTFIIEKLSWQTEIRQELLEMYGELNEALLRSKLAFGEVDSYNALIQGGSVNINDLFARVWGLQMVAQMKPLSAAERDAIDRALTQAHDTLGQFLLQKFEEPHGPSPRDRANIWLYCRTWDPETDEKAREIQQADQALGPPGNDVIEDIGVLLLQFPNLRLGCAQYFGIWYARYDYLVLVNERIRAHQLQPQHAVYQKGVEILQAQMQVVTSLYRNRWVLVRRQDMDIAIDIAEKMHEYYTNTTSGQDMVENLTQIIAALNERRREIDPRR